MFQFPDVSSVNDFIVMLRVCSVAVKAEALRGRLKCRQCMRVCPSRSSHSLSPVLEQRAVLTLNRRHSRHDFNMSISCEGIFQEIRKMSGKKHTFLVRSEVKVNNKSFIVFIYFVLIAIVFNLPSSLTCYSKSESRKTKKNFLDFWIFISVIQR